ncbi:MAG: hypothetical protein HUU46_01155 [Candidatus Hydrogenedentes bacterium]|nr:hypothetical protein [Candidatus Hydrogenedentota bacterium]
MPTTDDGGYVNYFEILDLGPDAKPGEVRKSYRTKMKNLVAEIAAVEITEERRAAYLLEMAKLNAGLFLLRETELRDAYWQDRQELINLEHEWCQAAQSGADTNELRKSYDSRVRAFLSRYVEDAMLAAGRDKECVEVSHWDPAHERHASRILRHYRNGLYQQILERLPFAEVTKPDIDWDERRKFVAGVLAQGAN